MAVRKHPKCYWQVVLINQHRFTVIGVAPPQFFGADPRRAPDVYIPLQCILTLEGDRAQQWFTDPNGEWVVTIARLRPGVSGDQAQAVLAPQLAEWMRTMNTIAESRRPARLVVRGGSCRAQRTPLPDYRLLVILLTLVALILTT